VFTAVGLCCRSIAGSPEQVKQQFDSVMSQLDKGGDTLVVMNIDGLLDNAMGFIQNIAAAQAEHDSEAATAQAVIDRLRVFLNTNGLGAARAIGMSTVPRADGMTTLKMVVSRDTAAADLPLWRGMFGGAPRKLDSVGFVPEDAAVLSVRTVDVAAFWKMLRAGINQVAPPVTAAEFNKGLDQFCTKNTINLDQVMASLGDEIAFSVQLSKVNKIALPAANGKMTQMPEPSVLVVLKLKDNTLPAMIESQLMKNEIPVVEQEVNGVKIRSVNLPIPAPFLIQPSYAVYKQYLVGGSSAKVVTDALAAFGNGKGFTASTEFKKAFAGLPMVNNGIGYVSPRYMQMIMEMMNSAGGHGEEKAVKEIMQALMGGQNGFSEAYVVMNQKNGILCQGVTSMSGRKMLASMTFAPVLGMGSAIAMPAFAKARTTARMNACINNLRMIDAAKDQWAMENNAKNGDEVKEDDIKGYLRGNAMPVCPQGGQYTIGTLGENPECSMHPNGLARPVMKMQAPPAMPVEE